MAQYDCKVWRAIVAGKRLRDSGWRLCHGPGMDAADTVELRRALHALAELSLEEHRTSAVIREQLQQSGVEVLSAPTPTGALAVVRGATSERSIAFRADIDALPIRERTGLGFASTSDVMHACGHDAHTAMLLAAADELQARAHDLPCDVLLVFQPGEELAGGARQMLDAGLFDQGRLASLGCTVPTSMTGLHVAAMMPTGRLGLHDGLALSGADVLEVRVSGAGGHGAFAGQGGALIAAAEIAQRLSEVVSGMNGAGTPAACSAGLLTAGRASNVLPDTARLLGTLRTFDDAQRAEALARLQALLGDIDARAGTVSELTLGLRVPPVVNDASVTDVVRQALGQAGMETFRPPPLPPSDDISELFTQVPGVYLFLGAAPEDGSRAHHSAEFDIDEAVLPFGITVLTAAARALAHDAVTGP